MRLERVNQDKIRVFLTSDDLLERGIDKNDIWFNLPKVHELFNDMMDQAYEELDFEVTGPLAVEVFNLPAQGMVVIVTKGKGSYDSSHDDKDDQLNDYYELEVTLDEFDDVLYSFKDLEDVIRVSHRIQPFIDNSENYLYLYENKYYLLFEDLILDDPVYELVVALLSEYGEPSMLSKYILREYGELIMNEAAVFTICKHFQP